jgi:porin
MTLSSKGFDKYLLLLFAVLLYMIFGTSAWAAKETKSGYEHDSGFAGPASSGALLREADEVKKPALRFPTFDKAFQPWFDWKGELKEKHDFELGLAYTSLYQSASDAPTGNDDNAGSGIFRLTTRWTLLKNEAGDTGTLAASYDHRHAYTDSAPGAFGFAGNYGISGTLFSDVDGILGDLNWQQSFGGRNTGLVVGRYDPNDYFDVLGYANPWSSFQSLYILFNGSIALPDYSTGIGVGHWLNEQWYVKAAANDVNGVLTESKFKFDLDELYTTAEIGWSPTRDQRYFQNVHLTYWHADPKENGGSVESDGITVGTNWTWDNRWMVFAKAGWSDGSAPLYNESYTVGMLHYISSRSDLLGLATNWGDPPSGSGLNDQTTTELFYRLQLAQNLAITPSLQFVTDPALNPAEDSLTIFGLRLRLTL